MPQEAPRGTQRVTVPSRAVNRLASETSPYLLQHAGNPVDWYPWGEEALTRARELDLPILLSIGYSACHWCHVMEHESFEDQATADLMNRLFVPIKVDREERPDLDAIYMQAVLALTGHGGWPMTVFLTPAGEPFYGGTYYPPEPRGGMPSFRNVLEGISEAYRERRGDVQGQAAQLAAALQQRPRPAGADDGPSAGMLTDALLSLRGQFDERRGGFGGAPKFPPSCALWFLLRMYAELDSEEALRMAEVTLDRMAAGGIHDQLAGGFHRYAVDAIWLVPHFEKMLYDNALLARAYLQAYEATGAERHAEVAASTLDYLVRELRLPHGGYASATDADTDGVEGSTFVWTPRDVRALLGDDAALVEALYGITEEGNFEGATVLSQVITLDEASERSGVPAERLPALRARMLEARLLRPQPGLDDKALASWNGMALAALAEGARVLERPGSARCRRAVRRVPARPALAAGRHPLAHPPRRPQLDRRLPGRSRPGRRRASGSCIERRSTRAGSPRHGGSRCWPTRASPTPRAPAGATRPQTASSWWHGRARSTTRRRLPAPRRSPGCWCGSPGSTGTMSWRRVPAPSSRPRAPCRRGRRRRSATCSASRARCSAMR